MSELTRTVKSFETDYEKLVNAILTTKLLQGDSMGFELLLPQLQLHANDYYTEQRNKLILVNKITRLVNNTLFDLIEIAKKKKLLKKKDLSPTTDKELLYDLSIIHSRYSLPEAKYGVTYFLDAMRGHCDSFKALLKRIDVSVNLGRLFVNLF